MVDKLNNVFPLPVEVIPSAWKQVQTTINDMNAESSLRMAVNKAGPVVTDEGNLILDVLFQGGINDPHKVEYEINNIPGVLENGLFVDLTTKVLVGKIENNIPKVFTMKKT